MVHQRSPVSEQFIIQQLTHLYSQAISEIEFSQCFQQIEFLEPTAGKPFWQSADAAPGIYLVLAGKVRLLDRNDDLIVSLEAGKSFGELTLFPEANFQPYTARASVKLKLAYLSHECLQALFSQQFGIRDQIYRQAVLWDLLLLCRQIAPLRDASLEALMSALSLLEPHNLKVGKLPPALSQNQRLWLLRRGELLNNEGQSLIAGALHPIAHPSQSERWQVVQPTELYSLNQAQWETALHHLPQLAGLMSAEVSSSQELEDGNGEWGVGNGESVVQDSNLSNVAAHLQSNSQRASATQTSQPLPSSPLTPHSSLNQKAYFPRPSTQARHWWQQIVQRYPIYRQNSASDCGAACLVMVGRYWGKRFNVNRLREIANVDRNGSSLRGLAAAAESIGFSARPVRASLDSLAKQNLPAIAHWEGNHYIVVYQVTRDRVIVGDPAIGQLSLSRAAFKAGWAGYTLLLQPTVLLKDADESQTNFWRFFELVKPHWFVLLEVFLASIFIQIFGLVTPLLTQLLLDRVIVQRSELTLTAIGAGLLIFSLFSVAMTGLRQYLLDHTANRIDLALIVGFIKHAFRLPLRYFESRYVGDIISRVQENHKIQRFLTGEALSVVLDLLTVFVYVGLMLWYSWKLALLVLVIVPPFTLLTLIATPFLQRISREIFNAITSESSYLIESFTGIRTIKSMAIEQTVRWHWEELFNKTLKTSFSGQVVRNALMMFSATIEAVATTALLWFGAWQVIHNQLTIGQLVAFNMLLGNVINPFQRLTVIWNQFQEVVIAIERIDDVIESEPEEGWEAQSHQLLPPLRGHIRFEQVTFRYHPESEMNTLENISFEVQPGQTVALVGRSGSGKTTISKLVLGLYPPTEGKILIDGYDVTSLALRSLREQIGVVDQDTFLFGSTIRDNISMGHPEAKLDAVIEAARQAGADQFIKELPMGYDTKIGEAGGTLSGGQRQRLAIARALLSNPQLLILDEATSSLDAESERIIQTNLNNISRDRTTLIIAHRLSTIRNADLILVLDRGVLVEKGTHTELMAKRGQYFYLNQQQLTTVG
ncbi:MAG: peptidase domain-containing ABC transporter [Stenomitos rutilans HA7619-LM2]|nr:peptidase domain-containing ABC transporter [Stenomitos rutilans HA7619-LM2]